MTDFEPDRTGTVGATARSVIVALVAVALGVGLIVGLVRLLGGDDQPGASSVPSPAHTPEGNTASPPPADVLSPAGWADLLAAIQEQTGQMVVFDATLYPTYAVLELPEDRETRRYARYYWDGSMLESQDSFGTASGPRVDLADISVDGMLRLSKRVRSIIEEPTSYYVLVRGKDSRDGAVVYAYANNKYSEGGYLSADENGKRIRKVTW